MDIHKGKILADFKFINTSKKITGKKLGELRRIIVQSAFSRLYL